MNNPASEKSFSAFLPVSLVALAIIILLGWNLSLEIRLHSNNVRIQAQQEIQLGQAAQVEAKLQQMMADLVTLAQDDAQAEAIVKRYGIAFNPPKNAVNPPPPLDTGTGK